MSETKNTPSKEGNTIKPQSSPSCVAIATIIAAIFTCASAVIVAALNPDLAKIILERNSTPTNTPTGIKTQTSVPSISTPSDHSLESPVPVTTKQAKFSPGGDWLHNCVSEQWVIYPPAQILTESNCFTEPIPGFMFTANNRLVIRAEPDVFSAEEYGIFAQVPQSGTVRIFVDLDRLENAEVWIGIYSEPDIKSDGILMVVPYYVPANPPGSDTRKRAFAIRYMQMPLENRLYLSKEFEDPDGIYEIGFNLTSGTVAGFMENVTTDEFPFPYNDRWLFIGYRALIRRSNVDVSFSHLEILER